MNTVRAAEERVMPPATETSNGEVANHDHEAAA